MMNKELKISAGLAFMRATVAAFPRSSGERERIAAIGEAMLFAIRNRFAFDKTDAEALNCLNQRTSVGVFRAMDYYSYGCAAGGTYARMWETATGQKPWMALKAFAPRYRLSDHRTMILDNNRVAVDLGVLLPPSFEECSDALMHKGYQVWWVTAQDDDTITVCRYRAAAEDSASLWEREFRRTGQPVRRRKLTREQWAELNTAPVDEKQAA